MKYVFFFGVLMFYLKINKNMKYEYEIQYHMKYVFFFGVLMFYFVCIYCMIYVVVLLYARCGPVCTV